MLTIQQRMLENIYDLVKGINIPEGTIAKENGDWNELSQKHKEEATKELKEYVKGKDIEWDGNHHTIKIGKRFTIKLI